ncbi:MAG: DNRLRE domain-containing protein [Alphaproteobacteria bacterium]|nr:DNRLRE domain-containing protein [Alphaproteobacteria bacterium]
MLTMRHYLASLAVGLLLFGGVQTGAAAVLERGPYLQTPTASSMVLKWRTDTPTDSVVIFGDAPTSLTTTVSDPTLTTEHEVTVSGLAPDTRYYYSVGATGETLSGADSDHFFTTSPAPGTATPTRIWVIGDSGTANADAEAVRDAYKAVTGTSDTDLWLMLGDNAYPDGTDSEYQAAVFDTYPELLRKIPLWPTLGNHDGHNADSATQAGPYYDIFTLPKNGEAGGLPSGTEAYYSFDYGNIHFVNLESYETDRSPGGAMMTWLTNDLAANDKEWVIAFWHHPPYTKGSHNSDTEGRLIDMRQNALPILEFHGVDLVLSGHSHAYERSHLLDGHYGASNTLDDATMILDNGGGSEAGAGAYDKPAGGTNAGAVYAVAGSSGKTSSSGNLDHPAMYFSLRSLGSMILEVNANRLDVQFIDQNGDVDDEFTITKGPDTTPPTITKTEAGDAAAVTVTFSEKVEAASAEDVTNYAIDNSVDVVGATLAADERTVTLDTSPLTEGVLHTLTVNNVDDIAGNTIAANSQSQFTFVVIQTKDFQDGVAPTSGYAGTSDAYISEGSPNGAFGTATTLLVDGSDPSGLDLSSLMFWDISEIPSDALVDSASITINVTNVNSTAYNIYQMLTGWQETTVTWNEASSGTPWQSPGADGAADRGATVLGAMSSGVTGPLTVPLNQAGLDVIQSWIDGSAPNHGFITTNTSASNGLDFSSREASGALNHPKLSVTYSLPTSGPDTEPPSPPFSLTNDSKTDTSISFSWQSCESAPCDNVGVTGYIVYRNGGMVGTPVTPSYIDSGLTPDTLYTYEVSSIDAAGNESPLSSPLPVITDPAATPTVLVNDIAMSLLSNRKLRASRADVVIVDGNAQPVAEVTVSGFWSGLTSANVTGSTAGDGTITFDSAEVPKNSGGEFAFSITNLESVDHVYDEAANIESSDCITSGGGACSDGPGDPPGDPTFFMKVSSIVVMPLAAQKRWQAEAEVTVVDTPDGNLIPGATVTGNWTFISGSTVDLGNASAVTDGSGVARLLSPKRKANSGDEFIFTLTGVTKTDGALDNSEGQSTGSALVP